MPLAQGHGGQVLGVAADALDLVQGGAGGHEGEGAALDLFQGLPADGQTEAVHSHHGQALLIDLKQGAGVDRAALVGGHGEGRLLDHGPQGLLLDIDAVLVLHLRQLGIIGGAEAQDVEICVTAAEVDHQFVVGGEGDHVVGHAADDVAEQAGVQDDVAALRNVCGNFGADAGLHVVAGDRQLVVHVEQQTLQGGDGAFLRDGPAGDGDGALQQDLFTGEFHHIQTLPLYLGYWGSGTVFFKRKKSYMFRKSSRRRKNCGKSGKPLKWR